MVSTISPVVYRRSDLGRKGWLVATASHILSSVVGGGFMGGLFGLLGASLRSIMDVYQSLLPLVVGLLAVGYALHELRLVSLPYPQRQRQVPDHWRHKFHPYLTSGLFGLLLGTGFITFIPTATYYILALAVLLYGSPPIGIFIFAVYGATRAALLFPFSWRSTAPGSVERLTFYMDLTKPIMHQVNGFALAIAGAYLIIVYV
jgi:hypothetical protein